MRLRILKGHFTSQLNGMTSDGQNSVAVIVLDFYDFYVANKCNNTCDANGLRSLTCEVRLSGLD
jgi:hypothetical protein